MVASSDVNRGQINSDSMQRKSVGNIEITSFFSFLIETFHLSFSNCVTENFNKSENYRKIEEITGTVSQVKKRFSK